MDDTSRPTEAYYPTGADSLGEFYPLRLTLEDTGLSVELTRGDMVFGRHSEADVRLPLPDVSRWHCRFVFRDGGWDVIDLDSLNGVWVNEQPVREARVQTGDRVRIGGFSFAVEVEGPSAQEETLYRILRTLPRGKAA
jgi:pSer/pThr/pTyr-binding forkhead associated (FHA) protein